MKKKFRKTSALLSAVMLAGIMPTASMAAAETVYVSHFDSFDCYLTEKGTAADLPDGFFAIDVEEHPERAAAVGSVFLEEDGTRALALKTNAMIGYRFDEVYKTGVRRVSFDVKLEEEPTKGSFLINAHENHANDNVYDYWNTGVDGTGIAENGDIAWDYSEICGIYSPIADLTENTAFVARYNWSVCGEAQDVAAGEWHKVELVFDYDDNTLTTYCDGNVVYERTYTAKNKSVYFVNSMDTTVYLDNFAIYHGSAKAYATNNYIKAEAPEGSVSTEGGRLNIDFSRYISDISADASDFTVKNASGVVVEDAVTYAGNQQRASGLVAILDELPQGTYTISHTQAVNEASFTVSASKTLTADNMATEKYFYLDEDFETYLGGVPAGWEKTAVYTADVQSVVGTDANGGKSLKMVAGGGQSYSYHFNEPHVTGDLIVEFDVKSSGAAWFAAVLPEKAFAENTVDDYCTIGNVNYDGDTGSTINTNSGYGHGFNSGSYNYLNPGEWNHIKLTLNMDNRMYKLETNGKTLEFKFPTLTGGENKRSLYDTDGVYKGVGGVRFMSATNENEFDNIKVYSENSYNLYDDLNEYSYSWPYPLPAGWYRVQDLNNPGGTKADGSDNAWYQPVEGRNYDAETNPKDMAIKLKSSSWQEQGRVFLTKTLNPRNKSFALQYDIKIDALPTAGGIKVAPVPIEKAYKVDNTVKMISDYSYQDGVIDINKDGKLQYRIDGDSVTDVKSIKTDESFVLNTGEWYTIKLEFDPTTKSVTAYLNGEAGQTVTNSWPYGNLLKNYDNVSVIAFWNQESGAHSIDNIKVWELNDVTKSQLLNIKTVSADGAKKEITDKITQIAADVTAIELNFTSSISETEETMAEKTALCYTSGTAVAWKGELSNNGKTYTLKLNEKPDSAFGLRVKRNVKGGTSELAQVDSNIAYGFTTSEGAGEAKVSSVKLMKKVNGRTVSGRVVPTVWTAASGFADKDAAEYKLAVSGINTTGTADNTSYWYLTGTYTTEDGAERMISASKTNISIPKNVYFEADCEIPEIADGTIFKAFVWNTDFVPVADAITNK